ncbi:hypothetical protein A2696_00345 [Candidatus Curtissbacteria bacterium RIFCSPHIGHO2_01_FULL_41_13]|uniref:Uncharacterized protein n=1 Tax=Candidatus Curtissbacteria bacterium RIFCSPHIGHO2_01_FULL_41_13 TaxID=1797745 RepID=A0A1F5G2I5_9BACT|nr:MAG: hypothetical protein A2696_00345 [Candidatus Curtissbacteria bacterium RIFCSPHIGHO2_01_FULL_41_13]
MKTTPEEPPPFPKITCPTKPATSVLAGEQLRVTCRVYGTSQKPKNRLDKFFQFAFKVFFKTRQLKSFWKKGLKRIQVF